MYATVEGMKRKFGESELIQLTETALFRCNQHG